MMGGRSGKDQEDTVVSITKEEYDALITALKGARSYLLNAKIDLQSGAPKRTALMTIEGGYRLVSEALRKTKEA